MVTGVTVVMTGAIALMSGIIIAMSGIIAMGERDHHDGAVMVP